MTVKKKPALFMRKNEILDLLRIYWRINTRFQCLTDDLTSRAQIRDLRHLEKDLRLLHQSVADYLGDR